MSIRPKTGSPSSGKQVNSNKHKISTEHVNPDTYIYTHEKKNTFLKRVLIFLFFFPYLKNSAEDKVGAWGSHSGPVWGDGVCEGEEGVCMWGYHSLNGVKAVTPLSDKGKLI